MTDSGTICCAGEVMGELCEAPGEHVFQLGVAGDTFNTAVYLARFGLPVEYLSCLGDDRVSSMIVDRIAAEGIGSGGIRRLAGRTAGMYLVENDADGERHFTYWREHSAARSLFDEPVELPGISSFYFTGITLAVVQQGLENLLRLLSQLKTAGCDILFDPNYRPALWRDVEVARSLFMQILPYCDVILPTLEDETRLWGIDDVQSCRDFYAQHDVREIVIKAPDLTAHAWLGNDYVSRPASRVEPLDTTGAGDAFNAGYLGVRLKGGEVEQALEQAQSLAALVVQNQGAILPRAQ